MFSGQGSHYYQMGRALYEQMPALRRRMDHMDAIVRDLTGESVVEAIYDGRHSRDELFEKITLSHPAIVMVECALAHSLMDAGLLPDMVLGASLGMFAAAEVAGCIQIEDALAAAVRQASLLEEHCEKGVMLAVLAAPEVYEMSELRSWAERAGINFKSHFVLSAPRAHCGKLEELLREKGISCQKLAVSFAFHSRWMDAIKEPFQAHLRSIRIKPPRFPLICCAEVGLLHALPQEHFWHVTRESIRFQQTIEFLESQDDYLYIDSGPAGTLATFVKYVLSGESRSQTRLVLSLFGNEMENLKALLADTAAH